MSVTWDEAVEQLKSAVQDLLRGDGSAYQELWSHRGDVTMMGAYGGLATGWEQVSPAVERAAGNYTRWDPDYQEELLAAEAIGEMGYVVLRESVGNRAATDDQRRFRRVTVLFRREAEAWKVFHHHSDPLHDPVRAHGSND